MGAEVDFQLKEKKISSVYIQPDRDTLFGVTYMVVSPEHPIIDKYKDEIKNWDEIAGIPRGRLRRNLILSVQSLQKIRPVYAIDGLNSSQPGKRKRDPDLGL